MSVRINIEHKQRLLQSVSPYHGRVLVYVWAIEQDELSKRNVPDQRTSDEDSKAGRDVFVPWVLSTPNTKPKARKLAGAGSSPVTDQEVHSPPQVFNRYYHMFAKGELTELVHDAATDLGLYVGPSDGRQLSQTGVEIVQDGWERSNYYVELRCWTNE